MYTLRSLMRVVDGVVALSQSLLSSLLMPLLIRRLWYDVSERRRAHSHTNARISPQAGRVKDERDVKLIPVWHACQCTLLN